MSVSTLPPQPQPPPPLLLLLLLLLLSSASLFASAFASEVQELDDASFDSELEGMDTALVSAEHANRSVMAL